PQISIIMGPCAGGAVYSPAMTDFILMVKETAHMFITGPQVIKTVTGEETNFEDLGGAVTHNTKSGNAHFACESDEDAIEQVKLLLSFIPGNNLEEPPYEETGDNPARLCTELDEVIPDDPKAGYDMIEVIESIVDNGDFMQIHELYAANAVIGMARLNGRPVGIIANQPMVLAGCLDIDASDKISRFIRFCDAFNLPIITFVDVPGYLPGTEQEWNGIIRHGAKLLWSYSEATVPKLNVTTRKSYGGAYIAMSSRHLGNDMSFAWPSAEIAVMGAQGAVNVVSSYRKEQKAAADPDVKRQEQIKDYEEKFNTPYIAAERGYVDAVILPSETRMRLIDALDILCTKREALPPKKHGNIPV
ncbi:MAG: methylmalonyl-CoA carboxyltransferase, partial [Candidatus Cloacimonetes bacterium]|nr:methylmalonyl-CoA carboxyltransferase [Candidatus Cloacimonadota bacterium]